MKALKNPTPPTPDLSGIEPLSFDDPVPEMEITLPLDETQMAVLKTIARQLEHADAPAS